jgi:UDP-N-acetylmuramate dehydrogenase
MNISEARTLMTLRGRWMLDEPMARHLSWRAGGHAKRAYVPADLDDLCAMVRAVPADEPLLFVGLGSNLLVRDGGFDGTVVFTHGALKGIALTGSGTIYAEAGVASPKVARFAALHGLVGAEFLAGIPGTVGGALAMNAGCYGGETWQVVRSVKTLARDGVVRERSPDDYDIGYRHVAIQVPVDAGEEWFVATTLSLAAGSGDESRATIKNLLARRIASQPLNQPNAGSVFRNPPGDYAARLIEACELKGERAGGAAISAKHANFIVNLGGASAADIESLIVRAQTQVATRFGVNLQCEVRIVGDPR